MSETVNNGRTGAESGRAPDPDSPEVTAVVAANAELIPESPEHAFARVRLQQFGFWWRSVMKGRRAGPAIYQMWRDYQNGAILLDESWVWWSIEQVVAIGQETARAVGYPHALVVASSPNGVAAVDWPDGWEEPAVLRLVPARSSEEVAAQSVPSASATVSPERFLSAKGFDQPDRMVACAYLEFRKPQQQAAQLPDQQPGSVGEDGAGEAGPATVPKSNPQADPAAYRSRRRDPRAGAQRVRSAPNSQQRLSAGRAEAELFV